MNKKFFVLALTLILVVSFSAISFAALDKKAVAEINGMPQIEDGMGHDFMMPSAPGIASKILKFNKINARYGKGRNGGNFIADVARHMGPRTDFSGVSRDMHMEYCMAVMDFLHNHAMMTKHLIMPGNMFFGNVVAEDFGVMDVSEVKGYTVGFGLINAKASDVKTVVIKLYNGTTLLGMVTSSGALTTYPTATSLSAPFDVLGTFDYAEDGNWIYSGWMGDTSVIPTKAEITVTFNNNVVKTAVNTTLTGDTSIFTTPTIVVDATMVYGATVTSWYVYDSVDYLDTSVNFNFDKISIGDIDSIKFTLFDGATVLGTRKSEGANLVTLLKDCAQYWDATPDTYLAVTGQRTMSAAFKTRDVESDNGYWVSSASVIAKPDMPTRILVEVQVGNIIYQAEKTY